MTAFRATTVAGADLRAAKYIVLIETSLPSVSNDVSAKVKHLDDVPSATINYSAASAALKARVEELVDEFASR